MRPLRPTTSQGPETPSWVQAIDGHQRGDGALSNNEPISSHRPCTARRPSSLQGVGLVHSYRTNVSLIYPGFLWDHPLMPWLDEAPTLCSLKTLESLNHGAYDTFLGPPPRGRASHGLGSFLFYITALEYNVWPTVSASRVFIVRMNDLNGRRASSSVFIFLRTVLIQLLPRQIFLNSILWNASNTWDNCCPGNK